MIIFKRSDDLSAHLEKLRLTHSGIGFVPTMGALHPGHVSLIKRSKECCDVTISSIFINPTQFNNSSDLEKYPVTIEKDIYLLEKSGCDIVYLPSVKDVYPDGLSRLRSYDLGFLETVLEGKFRPGHFQGVCQVVDRLLHTVNPTDLFIGQKDYQQCKVITKLVEIIGMHVNIIICETLREPDGLAMSSRNMRLNEVNRKKSTVIIRSLKKIQSRYKTEGINAVKQEAVNDLAGNGFKVDYVEIAAARDLGPVSEDDQNPKVALIAAWLDDIRLIDNFVLA